MALSDAPLRPVSAHDQANRRMHFAAASLAAAGGLVHVLAGEGHFQEWWGYGMFFVTVSLCQFIGGAALLFWSNRAVYRTGIIGTALILAVWTVSRTVGVPIGPDSVAPERVGVLDMIANVLEVALIMTLAWLTRHPGPAPLEGVLAQETD